MAHPAERFFSDPCFQIELKLRSVVFLWVTENRRTGRKLLGAKTQPHYDVGSRIRTRTTLLGGKLSSPHHTLSSMSYCLLILRSDMRECPEFHRNKSVYETLTILFSSFSLCDPPVKVTPRVDEHSSV